MKTNNKNPRQVLVMMAFCCLFLGGAINTYAQEVEDEEPIEFGIAEPDDMPGLPGNGKVPLRLPQVWLSDYLLDFHGSHAEYVLNVVDDATNTVVYTTPVPSSVTQVMLPATLSGDYRIELLMGSWLFYGYITL